MTALTASGSALPFVFGTPRRQLSTHHPRRSEGLPMLSTLALAPLTHPRHSLEHPDRRKRSGRGKGGSVWAEVELGRIRDLETEIYQFMEMSANPSVFPSKNDLIAAGREDLVRAIGKERGWLAYGWDSDEEYDVTVDGLLDVVEKRPCEGNSRIFQHNMASVVAKCDVSLETESNSLLACSEDSSGASSSGRLMGTNVSTDSGIEGILSRERSIGFGFVPRKDEELMLDNEDTLSMIDRGHAIGNVDRWSYDANRMSVSSSSEEGTPQHFRALNSHHIPLVDVNNNSEPGTWRAWSIKRSGDPLTNFEAAEIVLDEEQKKSELNFVSHHLMGKKKESLSEVQLVARVSSRSNFSFGNDLGCFKDEISVHLLHLESKLNSVLELLNCKTSGVFSYKDKGKENLLKELHNLSDALEFQQNEIKKARDILRSTRAKLAIIVGKLALEVIEIRRSIEEKHMGILTAEMAQCMLRSVWIVWPDSASEVFLAGSFDGWTSQRRMEKKNSRDRVFSLGLKLYPGRYEIKFIVDGVWTVDKLRPIINSGGFQNNLLIVT